MVEGAVIKLTIGCSTSIDKVSTHSWSLSMLAWMSGEVWREEEKVAARENKIVGLAGGATLSHSHVLLSYRSAS